MAEENWIYLDESGLEYYDEKIKDYIKKNMRVLCASTSEWDSHPDLIGYQGYIYIYSDWGESPDGRKIAGFKVGDGETYLKDIIFTDQMFYDHIRDNIRHITQTEREYWNNKVSCLYNRPSEKLTFIGGN